MSLRTIPTRIGTENIFSVTAEAQSFTLGWLYVGLKMLALTPFLLFDGDCAEAMNFYHRCLGGELSLMRLGDTPMAANMPPEQHGRIAYAHIKSDAVEFSATDWLHPVHVRRPGNSSAMYVTGSNREELLPVFERLREGAATEFFEELCQMPFGTYGRFTDRFGVEWFFRSEA